MNVTRLVERMSNTWGVQETSGTVGDILLHEASFFFPSFFDRVLEKYRKTKETDRVQGEIYLSSAT